MNGNNNLTYTRTKFPRQNHSTFHSCRNLQLHSEFSTKIERTTTNNFLHNETLHMFLQNFQMQLKLYTGCSRHIWRNTFISPKVFGKLLCGYFLGKNRSSSRAVAEMSRIDRRLVQLQEKSRTDCRLAQLQDYSRTTVVSFSCKVTHILSKNYRGNIVIL